MEPHVRIEMANYILKESSTPHDDIEWLIANLTPKAKEIVKQDHQNICIKTKN